MQQIADALRRDGDSSNTLIGIIILVLLLTYIGPDVLPQLVENTLPFLFDEGVTCGSLRRGEDRGNHQSLIGRAAEDPLILRVEADSYPTDGNPWNIRIIVINNTIGTIPIYFEDNQVIVGDDGNSGIGLIFSPASSLSLDSNNDGIPNSRPGGITSFPEENIHVLGPRQRCVVHVSIPPSQLNLIAQGQGNERTRISAYYRISNAGAVNQGGAIFTDQGMDILDGGIVVSDFIIIPITASASDS